MLENIFAVRKIDSEYQKHELLLSSLVLQHLQHVEHVLQEAVYPYSYLKAALVRDFGQTKEHQLYQLLHACDLGDRKHTELLAEMRELLGAKGSPVLLKKLFMNRLPSNVRRVFVAGPMDNLDDVARRTHCVVAEDRSPSKLLADKIDRPAESFNSFLQLCPVPQTVTLQTNSFPPTPTASTKRDFQRPLFSRPGFSSTPY